MQQNPLPELQLSLATVHDVQPATFRAVDLRLSVVVPTFNEAANVHALVLRLKKTLGDDGWEAIFVDDDSPDGTSSIVRALAQTDSRIRCLQRIGRRGLSSACVEGMLASAAPTIAVMDADLQHDEAMLPRMLERIEQGDVDVVIATRYAAGGGTDRWSESRKRMSRIAVAASRGFLKQRTSDPMSGFFMVRREVVDTTARRLSALGFKILLDILLTAKEPLRVAEVPYQFRNRNAGESKLDELVVWEYGMLLADKTIGRYLPVRFLAFSIVGGLGVIVHMAALTVLLYFDAQFSLAQSAATVVAMISNYAINNVLTYRDRRLSGLAWVGGLLSFMAACSLGALANIGIGIYLFANDTRWAVAALAGILVGAVWNYVVTQFYTWGEKR